jgi:hypothetical protein
MLRLAGIVVAAALLSSAVGLAQDRRPEPSRTVTIPFLANRTNPSDLDFMAAQCDVAPSGEEMVCRFRQVFLTISAIDSKSCVITTSGFDQTFRRVAAASWVSEGRPDGACGRVETATLEDGGGTRWTLTLRAAATRTEQPQCRAAAPELEIYDWTNVKRPLPCASIQPGAIER